MFRMKIRVNTICPGIFPSEMTGKNDAGQGLEYDLGEGAGKAAKRCTAGTSYVLSSPPPISHPLQRTSLAIYMSLLLIFLHALQEKQLTESLFSLVLWMYIGRPGLPEEIVGPVLLLSSKAGGYFDGAMLTVDGGRLMVSVLFRLPFSLASTHSAVLTMVGKIGCGH